MITEGMMSSATDEWATPQDLYDELDAEFNFDIDVCATNENAKCVLYWTKEDDALSLDWGGGLTLWMNPPYGRQIGRWMNKALEAAKQGSTVVCLVPARTDTAWWHDTAMKVYPHGIRFLRGRLYHVRGDGLCGRAPFPSAVVILNPKNLGRAR